MIYFNQRKYEERAKSYNRALVTAIEVEALIRYHQCCGSINVYESCHIGFIDISLHGDYSMDYFCAVVADIEVALGLEDSEVKTETSGGFVTFYNTYKDVGLHIYVFPHINGDSCYWVDTGEEYTSKVRKLVCL